MVAGKRKDTRFAAEEASRLDDRIEEQIVQEITEQVLVEFFVADVLGGRLQERVLGKKRGARCIVPPQAAQAGVPVLPVSRCRIAPSGGWRRIG
jgi:hypothetical protein